MKYFSNLLLVLFILSCASPTASTIGDVTTVTGGQISGAVDADSDLRIFKGIPFAAPPVGELRWRAPQPVIPWEGIKECTAFGASPMQGEPLPFMFWSEEFLIPKEPISEDCLTLNIWTGAKNTDEKLPVLAYIYGGGFRSGGSACPIYDGIKTAKKGVIFVSMNYRVGAFGFQAHPELSAESESGTSGNYGILDIIAALKWIQENIAAFGGDPNNVTIAGQSAGAFAVNHLTSSPLATGLFHQAIAQSGASFVPNPLRPNIDKEQAEQTGLALQEEVGASSLAELRSKTAQEILNAQSALQAPYVDGHVLPEPIYDIYTGGTQNDVPIMVGWNKEDILFVPPNTLEQFRQSVAERFADLEQDFYEAYPTQTEEDVLTNQKAMSRDQTFGIQVYTWGKMQSQTGTAPVYMYNFNRALPAHTPETQFGAFHSGEIVYAYDNLHTLDRPWQPIDQEIANIMSNYWVNFTKTRNPNGEGLPEWKTFDADVQQTMIIDTTSRSMELPTRDQMAFWEMYFRQI